MPSCVWCERRDLNPHALRHWILSPARLPFRHSRVRTKVQQNRAVLKLRLIHFLAETGTTWTDLGLFASTSCRAPSLSTASCSIVESTIA